MTARAVEGPKRPKWDPVIVEETLHLYSQENAEVRLTFMESVGDENVQLWEPVKGHAIQNQWIA